MPRRERADRGLILAAYERLRSAQAVARELGLHPNTVYDALREQARECVTCHQPVVLGRRMCAACLDKQAARMRHRRKERARAGICASCDRPKSPLSSAYCEEHRLQNLERQERHKVAKRGTPHPHPSTRERRLEAVRSRYGEGAAAVWQASGGICAGCGVSYEKVSIQMHHLDCDSSNNAPENFAPLCFTCHQTAHFLLRSQDREGFLAWFAGAYPA